VDRTILVKQENFSYALGEIFAPRWIYLSSLGQNSVNFHAEIADYLAKNPEVKLAFQPGTFQMKLGMEILKNMYARAEIFICNVQEAELILKDVPRNLPMLLRGIAALGPKVVVITDGYDGAYAYDTRDPDNMWFMPIYPHTPFERTGAGDAYASTIVSALLIGKNLSEALQWAGINAMSVTQFVGAQKGLLTMEKIEEYLAKAPSDYSPRKL
jgi:sugar/nucleoside kinase (ribokinase family)